MDGRGGCCLVRYAGDADVASKVELIMLRYRPIAPKPTSPGESPPSASQAAESTWGAKVGGSKSKRRGRKEKEGAGRRGRKKRAPYPGDGGVSSMRVVAPPAEDLITLQLMPETPVPVAATSSVAPDLSPSYPWGGGLHVGEGPGTVPSPAAGSWLTLECVTETCEVVGEGRCSWAEAWEALEGDACPAFLSDASDRVAWMNEAYRRMAGAGEVAGEVAVALATGGRVPDGAACAGGFSCSLRVRCARRHGEKAWSLVVPCDVWRLAEDGWLAWRLDVKAALSLGR